MTKESGESTASEFKKGSPEAVQGVRERVRRILAFGKYRIPPEDRKDLEQEVMTQIWQAVSRPGFEPGERFWGFVEVVTARRCIDWLRASYKASHETTLTDNLRETSAGPLGGTLAQERSELAHKALTQLAKPCRDLIYLRFGLEKSYRELATLLEKSESALRVQMFRCIKKAQRVLGELEQDQSSERTFPLERQ